MKIYLAGKVEGRKWEVVKNCSSIEWISSDGTNHSEHLWGCGLHPQERIGSTDLRSTVRTEVVGKLTFCNGLVAYLDTSDSYGSIAEIAIMATLNKPCFVVVLMPHINFTEDPDTAVWAEAEKVSDVYWLVSCLPNVRAVTVETESEAADVVRGYVLGMRVRP